MINLGCSSDSNVDSASTDEIPSIARIDERLSVLSFIEFHILSFIGIRSFPNLIDSLFLLALPHKQLRIHVILSKHRGRSGYQQKDRKPSQNDKTEHGMEKTVKNQGQRPKKPKSESILKNQHGPAVAPMTAGKPRDTTQVVTRGIQMIANHMLQSEVGVCQYEVRVEGIRANDWRGD
ncbi:hypothetical protein Tco_1235635 [Tanacetum coccineum]